MKLIPHPEILSHSFKLALHFLCKSLMFVSLNIGHMSQRRGQMSCSVKKTINCHHMLMINSLYTCIFSKLPLWKYRDLTLLEGLMQKYIRWRKMKGILECALRVRRQLMGTTTEMVQTWLPDINTLSWASCVIESNLVWSLPVCVPVSTHTLRGHTLRHSQWK